jgi:hypothetical protein
MRCFCGKTNDFTFYQMSIFTARTGFGEYLRGEDDDEKDIFTSAGAWLGDDILYKAENCA